MGLDLESKELLSSLLDRISSGYKSDSQLTTQVVLGLRSDDSIPDWINHILVTSTHETMGSGPRESIEKMNLLPKRHTKRNVLETVYRSTESLEDTAFNNPKDKREVLVDAQDVRIAYRGKEILKGFSWKIRRGDRWGLFGPNGMTYITNLYDRSLTGCIQALVKRLYFHFSHRIIQCLIHFL